MLIFKKIQNYITGLWNGVEAEQLPQLGLLLQKRIENENDVVEGLPNPIYCYPLQKHATTFGQGKNDRKSVHQIQIRSSCHKREDETCLVLFCYTWACLALGAAARGMASRPHATYGTI